MKFLSRALATVQLKSGILVVIYSLQIKLLS